MNRKRWLGTGIVVLLLVVGAAWGFGYLGGSGEDPAVTSIRKQMNDLREKENTLTDAQRRAMHDQMRKQINALQPEQRHELFASRHEHFRERMEQRMNEFFALPPAKRTAALDAFINEMEKRRREGPAGFGPGQGRRGGPPGANRSGNRNGPNTGANRQGNDARGPGGRPPRGPRDPEARMDRYKRRLSHSSPEMRSKMTEFRRLLNQRRKERGLPEIRRGPPRGR